VRKQFFEDVFAGMSFASSALHVNLAPSPQSVVENLEKSLIGDDHCINCKLAQTSLCFLQQVHH